MIIIFVVLLLIICLSFFSLRDIKLLLSRHRVLAYGGLGRRYLLSKTKKSNGQLIIGLHGLGDRPRQFAYYSALHSSFPEGMVIYPRAVEPTKSNVKRGWNCGFCCGSGWAGKIDDVGFILALVKRYVDEGLVNPNKVYVVGFSNGAFMAQRLAAEHPDKIAGVVSVAGTIGTKNKRLKPTNELPILLMHGKQDKTIPCDGGINDNDPDFDWLSFEATKKAWIKIGAKPQLKIYDDLAHGWPGWRLWQIWRLYTDGGESAAKFISSLNKK